MTGNLLLASFMLTGVLWLLGEPVAAPVLTPTYVPTFGPTLGTTPPASPQPSQDAPSASIVPTAAPTPSPKPTAAPQSSFVVGVASWYDWRAGEAAAGPALRKALGPNWRGQTVKVCGPDRCLIVKISDFCGCYRGTDDERLIDLDKRTFSQFGETSRGLLRVVVRW